MLLYEQGCKVQLIERRLVQARKESTNQRRGDDCGFLRRQYSMDTSKVDKVVELEDPWVVKKGLWLIKNRLERVFNVPITLLISASRK
jgi:hypothetical protein